MKEYWVKDISLADRGRRRIEWARNLMPVLSKILDRFREEKPLRGLRIGACLHITAETAILAEALIEGGAEVSLCASNPLSTQDDVAAALAQSGVRIYAFRGQSVEEYYRCIGYVLASSPHITIDDGADLISTIHKLWYGVKSRELAYVQEILQDRDAQDLVREVIGGCEETTTGVIRLRAMAREGKLLYPVIAVNDADSKRLFDNPIGTGQSALDGVIRATGMLLAGRDAVVVGFGNVGSGIAHRLKGMGARVTVVEVDPIKALRAVMDGFNVESMKKAAEHGELFITATGDINVIRREHFEVMKDGVILANAGHFDVEINKKDLEELSVGKERIAPCIDMYVLKGGKRIYLLGEGRLVNLVCAEGHPYDVMDMSFSLQALSAKYLAENRGKLPKEVLDVPKDIDRFVARLKLESMGIELEELTEEQKNYLSRWEFGSE
ncbi:MAG: adenosylhomocysteinase [Candidatus Wolframiiraptor sp.]|nr:MAG: adenosylhomocysteinase [Candidatus Wolframiiraptor sp.]